VRSTPSQTRPPPAPRWTASTAGQTALASRSCPGCLPTVDAWGRDPGLACQRQLLLRVYPGDQPAHREVKRVGRGFRKFANYGLRLLHRRRQVGGAPDRTARQDAPGLVAYSGLRVPGVRGRALALNQPPADDLAGRRPRDRLDELIAAHPLVGRHLLG
jgi:hypothetical protein